MTPIALLPAKRIADWQAQFALLGFECIPSTDDRDRPILIVARWGMCRCIDTIEELESFFTRVGGSRAA